MSVIAYRAWEVTEFGLESTGFGHSTWRPGLRTAVCRRPGMPHSRPACHDLSQVAVGDCSCGWYGVHDPAEALRMADDGGGDRAHRVAGVIQVAGRVNVHATGVRAERAVIRALAVPAWADEVMRARVESLAVVHGAILCAATPEGLAGVAGEWGRPMDSRHDAPLRPLDIFAGAARGYPTSPSETGDPFGWRAVAAARTRALWLAREGRTETSSTLLAVVAVIAQALGVPRDRVPRLKLAACEWLLDTSSLRDLGAPRPPIATGPLPALPQHGPAPSDDRDNDLLTDREADDLAREVLVCGGDHGLRQVMTALGAEMLFDLESAAPLVAAGARHRHLINVMLQPDTPGRERLLERLSRDPYGLDIASLTQAIECAEDPEVTDRLVAALLDHPELHLGLRSEISRCVNHLHPEVWRGVRAQVFHDDSRPLESRIAILAADPGEASAAWALDQLRTARSSRQWRALAELAGDPVKVSAIAVERIRDDPDQARWWHQWVLSEDPVYRDALHRAQTDPTQRWAWALLAARTTDLDLDPDEVQAALAHPGFPARYLGGALMLGGSERKRFWLTLGQPALQALWRNRDLTAEQALTVLQRLASRRRSAARPCGTSRPTPPLPS